MQKVKLFFENIKSYIANNKTKSITILTVLILTIISSITLIAYSFYQNKSTQLIISGVALIDSSDVSIKVYRENKNDSGVGIGTYALSYYVPSSSSYTYQASKTECSDGVTITKYENLKFYVDATKKGKCKVYFDANDGYIDDYEVNLFVQKEAGNTDDKNYNQMGQLPIYETGYYYTVNTSKTNCTNGATVSIEGKNIVVLTTKKAVCNVYVDKSVDSVLPTITNLNNNSGIITATLNDNVSLSEYAITTSNTETPTKWNTIDATPYNLNSNVDNSGTYYIWVKDSANNVSISNSVTVSFTPLSNIVVNKSGNLVSSQDGTTYSISSENGIRYVGHNPDNFVCLDDNFSGTCIEDNLYRIIGRFDVLTNTNITKKKSSIKLIKYIPTIDDFDSKKFSISSTCNSDSFSDLCNYILYKFNNEFYNSLDTKYANLILNARWYTPIVPEANVETLTLTQYYQNEQSAGTINMKVGLPYLTDIGYSFTSSEFDRATVVGKINISQDDSSWMFGEYAKMYGGFVWTMNRSSSSSNASSSKEYHSIIYKGNITTGWGSGASYPTFYIPASLEVKSGNGSNVSPYRITTTSSSGADYAILE